MSEALVNVGAPAVLGWALPVADIAASVLASHLYSALATGTRIDEGVALARQRLFKKKNPNWHLLRLYSDATPLAPVVTRSATPGREPIRGRPASEDFLDPLGKSKVASREAFVGRRRLIQRCLTALRLPDASGQTHQAVLLHGMGGLGKSTLAARLCERMSTTHQRAVWVGKIVPQGLLNLTNKVDFSDIEMDKSANVILNDAESDLPTRLRYLLKGPMKSLPCLFVFDDFEDGNLDSSASGGYMGTPEALDVLSSLMKAIRSTNSQSRLIITSRFQFPIPPGFDVHQEGLESMHGAELDKKLELLPKLRTDADTQKELRDRAIKTSGGIPRLLEWLDRVLSAEMDHDAILSAMESKAEEFREDVLAKELLKTQKKALRRLLALGSLFQLPVPLEAVRAVGGDSEVDAHLERAVSLGLIEAGTDPIERKTRYLVSSLLAPLLADEISGEERKEGYSTGAKSLYQLWVTGENGAD